ncbi:MULTISPECIES: hypothetical protein [Rhizobium]|uniref:hypothetical protein n=1 Tax=Rhizobium TaxID=379 RepID=UPI00161C7E2D|nr:MULTISPECIES: hypothetical protein [Rhizobium]MBB3522308.1 hypothetical protein [Rhizobium sp. BK456]MDR9781996.1 hypothetical protein [Rhizobium redzepovicii]
MAIFVAIAQRQETSLKLDQFIQHILPVYVDRTCHVFYAAKRGRNSASPSSAKAQPAPRAFDAPRPASPVIII